MRCRWSRNDQIWDHLCTSDDFSMQPMKFIMIEMVKRLFRSSQEISFLTAMPRQILVNPPKCFEFKILKTEATNNTAFDS